MSSLAAVQADGYYRPPDFDPKKGGLNKQQGSHGALGDRAKKLHEGILIIRFEMPFNVWCEGCNHLIGKGVRFNAEKKQIGAYHSTKIWKFSMKSPCCKHPIEIQTDPKHAQYVIVSGARKKAEHYFEDPSADDDSGRFAVDPAARDRPTDALERLEAAEDDKTKARHDHETIMSLREQNHAWYSNDAANNRELRKRMREARKEEHARDARRKELGLPEGITLMPETQKDRLRASAVDFGGSGRRHAVAWKKDRKRIASSSIFSSGAIVAAHRQSNGGVKKSGVVGSGSNSGRTKHARKTF